MKWKERILCKAKKILAGFMALATFATPAADGLVMHKEQTVAQAASSVTLSSQDRGIIYANSRSDFRDETIYFVITTRFYDGDPSNNARTSEDTKANNPADDPSWRGDFKGLIDKLDYIKALGFTAIWITPVVENNSGYDYHGYHAYDFSAVDTRYESNGVTYQDLIDAVHAKGMKLIQDVVFNHTCNWGERNLNEIGGASLKAQVSSDVYGTRNQVVMNGTGDPLNIYHHNGFCGGGDWDNFEAQRKTIADDCFDLNTENPLVYNYLVDCYTNYINMGVDAFRVDTVKHISRLTLNSVFVPAFKKAGGDKFYMFGEICTKGHDVWYRGNPPISTSFYTWADDATWLGRWSSTDEAANNTLVEEHYDSHCDTGSQPTSNNAFLNGNEYHTPDYSQRSGMDAIDFQMHWSFNDAGSAFGTALGEDQYFNDSTWNVVYVDSHDYGPDECQTQRYTGGTNKWAENLSLMFTFRGIPCVYYGSEIEFQAGKPIDVGPNAKLSETGRAYFGDNIEGNVTATDFTVFGDTSGTVADTLNSPLSQHIMRLNRLRQAIPALRKGQYSTEGCSGNGGIAFKRRYTDAKTDSFVLVAISGNATFSGIPNGKYVDAVTGDVQNVSGGSLTANVSGQGNMKVYVLDTSKTPAPGRVIPNGQFLTDGGAAELIGGEEITIVNPTGITLSQTSLSIKEGTTGSVTATIAPSNATNKSVTWTTSNASVATVSGGTITGNSVGSAVITAKTSNGLTATVNVTVTENTDIVKPTGISISPTSLTLEEGDSDTLTATVTPSNATKKSVTWTSSDTSVATIDGNGQVTAVKEGTATITATTSNGYKATAAVTVEGKELPTIQNGVYFEKPTGWGSTINVYFFSKGGGTVGKEWPGTAMTDLGNGVYGYDYGSTPPSNLMVIFNDGGNQTANLEYVNNGYYNNSGYVKTIEPVSKGKVIVKYVDESGNVLSSQTMTGTVGNAYSTSAKTFDGYTLKTTPANASGTYTSSDITVTYVYKVNQVVTSGWKQDSKGWYYVNADGTYVKNAWKKIDNKWYHFDASGYMQTGWYKEGSTYYYFKSNGVLASDEWVENDQYYIDANGKWVQGKTKYTEGWQHDSKGYWYQNADGTYVKNAWKKISNQWYRFGSDGYMVTGWYKEGSTYYYLKSNGVLASDEWVENDKYYIDSNGKWVQGKTKYTEGWQQDSKGWWYQNADGTYVKSVWKKISNNWYRFGTDGYMVTGWYKEGSTYYYLKSNGVLASDEWVENNKYYIDANGKWVQSATKETGTWKQSSKGWWYQNSDGTYPKNEWKQISGNWYRFDANGYMVTGWYKEGNYYYYLKSNGVMAKSEWVANGQYYIDSNGHWIP
ncbi:MAG: Ig-like domain-containing protein [Lachnospiraceae bacterium]|nr:Ig-like domain-containing protein [Lachnospiraceae bacterium]